MATTETTTLPDTAYWIRPWYPGEIPFRAGKGHFVGHIYADCEDLLRIRPEPQEGAGWLDPRKGPMCESCLLRYDPQLHAAVFGDDDEWDDDE
jgi:hypothetical protein